MKKIFLIAVVLMLTTPAWAVTVTITAGPNGVGDANEVLISYTVTPAPADCEDGNRPRAFGLNITVSDGNIVAIDDYFEGECDDVNKGYGIFPGNIEIAAGAVTSFGSPVAPDDDPGAENTGLDTNTVVLEMGSLYVDTNCPPATGILCMLRVSLDTCLDITGNAARTGEGSGSGVVLENLGAVTVVFDDSFCPTSVSQFVPNVVGMIQADACDAIEDANLVVGDITWECNSTYGYDYVIGQFPPGGEEVPHGTEVALVKSLGECDWGDANDPTYPTLSASDGAVHTIGGGYLGASVDIELDGQPNATATGDDIAGATPDDEDGVVIAGGLVAKGAINPVAVTASAAGYLNAWLDKNADGDWADAGEQIFTDQVLALGLNNLTYTVDCDANSGPTVSRWRYTTYDTSGALSYDGHATDGEVEDHAVEIVCHVPDVVDMTMADANATLEAACFNVGVITYECNDVIADGNVISTDPAYCNYPECGTDVSYVVSTGPCGEPDCFPGSPSGNPLPADWNEYDFWVAAGKPYCWCARPSTGDYPATIAEFQCKGDADGAFLGKDKDGQRKWVTLADLTIFNAAWQRLDDATWAANPSWICADFAHGFLGKDKDGQRKWVTLADLDIFNAGWQKLDTDAHFTTNPCFP